MTGVETPARSARPNKLHMRKLAEIEALRADAAVRLAEISDREFLIGGLALYAAEGSFRKSYRAVADSGFRQSKHPLGCPASSIRAAEPTGE